MVDRRTFGQQALSAGALLATGIGLQGRAEAQDAIWPARPLRIVVPFAPGGSADVAARFVAPRLSERLGQAVTIDNRPGAGGTLGVGMVARNTAADGYTLLLAAAGALTISPHLNPNLGYDPVADLAPVSGFARIPLVLIANAKLPANTIEQLLALLRREPGRYSYATTGNGSAMHLAGESFKALTDTFVVHIPYRGSAPAVAAVMSGEVQLAVVDLTSVLGRSDGERIKTLTLLGKQRSALAPAIPTLAETADPRLKAFDVSGWFGLFAPARTPAPVVQRLNSELKTLLRADDLRERFKGFGIEPMPTSPPELGQFLRTELGNFAGIVQRANIKAE